MTSPKWASTISPKRFGPPKLLLLDGVYVPSYWAFDAGKSIKRIFNAHILGHNRRTVHSTLDVQHRKKGLGWFLSVTVITLLGARERLLCSLCCWTPPTHRAVLPVQCVSWHRSETSGHSLEHLSKLLTIGKLSFQTRLLFSYK